MRRFKMSVMTGLLLFTAIALSGCGKLGESEAEKMVKDACIAPSSFVKHSYHVDEKNGLAYLDFSAKNAFGTALKDRAYFVVRNNQIIAIDTKGVDFNILRELAEASPKNFKENVIYCKDIQKYKRDMDIRLEIMKHTWERLDGCNNYFTWKHARDEAKQVNKAIKRYYERYYESPAIVQMHYPTPPAYYKVILTGNFNGNWSAKGQRPSEYPD